MNDNSPFLRFINLVSLDQKIQSLINKKIALETASSVVMNHKKEHDASLEKAEQQIKQLRKNVDAQELEMKTLDSKEQDKKRVLNTLSDYRESQALKHEIESIQRMQIAQEKSVLDAWTQLENAQNNFEKKQLENAALLQDHDEQLQKIEHEKQIIYTELVDLMAQRAEKLNDIPEEWLEKYELMGQRVPNPVVPIEQNSCSGCYQQLTQQDIIRARHGALMQCKRCFRLLYLPEIMEQQQV